MCLFSEAGEYFHTCWRKWQPRLEAEQYSFSSPLRNKEQHPSKLLRKRKASLDIFPCIQLNTKNRQAPIGQGRERKFFNSLLYLVYSEVLKLRNNYCIFLGKLKKMLEHVGFILKAYLPQSQESQGWKSVFYKDTIQAVIMLASMKKVSRLFISTLKYGKIVSFDASFSYSLLLPVSFTVFNANQMITAESWIAQSS